MVIIGIIWALSEIHECLLGLQVGCTEGVA